MEVQLDFLIEKYKQYLIDKDLMKKLFNSKPDMSKKIYSIVLMYVRKIRAFQFKSASNESKISPSPLDIPRQFDQIFKLFEENRDISVSKLGKIHKALVFCLKRLDFKLESDLKLQESVYFKECLELLHQITVDFKSRLEPRQ